MRLFFIGFLILLFGASIQLNSQNVDVKSVDVNSLSDEQILKILKEIEKRGLTENEAVALAQARGLTQQQINALKQRIRELKMSGGSQQLGGDSGTGQFSEVQNISQKAEIDTAKADKRIFGFSFFNNENLTFDPSVNIPVSESYVVGPGDEIIIDVWGASQHNYKVKIDKGGTINITIQHLRG